VLKKIWGGTHLIAEQTSLQLWQRSCVNSTSVTSEIVVFAYMRFVESYDCGLFDSR
jgi:hypothetical protein